MAFAKNVFVNCPFHEAYLPLLRPLLFTIIYLGFEPRIALERLDSGEARLLKIISLLSESQYAIHDLSRLKSENAGEYYRLNMPFELGLDVGCRVFGKGSLSKKKCLILEAERYRYQAAISDLSNSDIGVHDNKPQEVVSVVRNWLNNNLKRQAVGPSAIWGAFLDFMSDNYDRLKARGFSDLDVEKLPIDELMECIRRWVEKR